jgi:hypothetical protein
MLPNLVLLLGLNWSSSFSVSQVANNREMCQLTHPDHSRIYRCVDEIQSQERNNDFSIQLHHRETENHHVAGYSLY